MLSKVLRRSAVAVAAVVVLGLLIVGAVHLPVVRARVLDYARGRVARDFGIDVQARALRYNLLGVSVELQQPVVSAHGDRPFLQADVLRLVLDRRVLLGTVDITRLELVRPRLSFVRHRDGSTNLPTSQTETTSSPSPIHLGIVAITQLTADAEDEGGGHKAALGPLDLALDTRAAPAPLGLFGPSPISVVIGGGAAGVDRSLAGQFGGRLGFDGARVTANQLRLDTAEGQLTLDGWIDVIADTIRAEAQGRLITDLARAAHLIGPSAPALSGTARADVTLRGSIADPTVHVVASANNLQAPYVKEATAQAEATYASGRVDIQRLDVTSDLGAATAQGSLRVTPGDASPGGNHFSGHLSNIDLDRVLAVVGTKQRLRVGSTVEGDVEVTLDGSDPFGKNWWHQTNATGSLTLASTGSGLAVGGRLDLKAHDARWTLDHHLRSPAGPTSLDGVISGEASQGDDGTFRSTLSGRSRAHVDALQPLIPFVRQAGVELPAQVREIDGSVDAVIDPAGTFAAPRAAATITGRNLLLPDYPPGQLDARIAVNNNRLTADTFTARVGPAVVNASGSYSWAGRIDARFDAAADDLHALARLAGVDDVPVTGSARLAGRLQGTAEAPIAQAELTGEALDAYEVAIGSVTAQLHLANNRLEVDGTAPSLNALLRGTVGIREPYPFQAEATLDGTSLTTLLPPSMRDQIATQGTVTTTIKGQGTINRPLESSGEANLRALDLTVSGIPVVLEAPATISVQPNAFSASRLGLRVGTQTAVQLQGTLGLNDVRDGLNVRVDGPLSDFLTMAASAMPPDVRIEADQSRVNLDLHVGGTLQAPQPTGTLSFGAASLRYSDEPPLTEVVVETRIEPARVAIQSIAANWLGARIQGDGNIPLRLIVPDLPARASPTGIAAWGSSWLASLPAEPRTAALAARVTGLTSAALAPFVDASTLQSVSGSVDATLTAEADAFTIERIRGLLVLDRATFVAADVPFEQAAPTRIRLANGRAQIEEFRWHAEDNELRVSGSADLRAPDRPVDIAVNGDIDLRILGAFVSGVASGGVAHSALTVKGPMASPEILGTLAVTGGELRLENPSFAASDLEGMIVVPANREATISLKGTVNGGAATVEGTLSLKDIAAPTGRVTLTARNVTLDYPEGFQTESNAVLVLTLNGRETNLAGQVDVVSGLYREPLVVSRSLLSGFGAGTGVATEGESSFLSHLTLDVKVTTAEQVRVDNNYGRLNLTANLQVTGTAAQPGAVGRIEAEPDGEIYLAGNTYRVESLVIDLTNPRAIAPDVSFLADTRIGDVPIEIALQCSATGSCERDVRSQAVGVTNQEAEALLFGISSDTDTAAAGAQLARLLSGELLGLVGSAVRLDTLRLEQGSGRADIFDDPTLIAGDVNPASRLTLGKRLGEHVELAYSQNLAENGFTMSTQYFAPAGISARALLFDDQSRSYEFRHQPRFGASRRKRPAAVAGAVVSAVAWTGDPGFPENELHRQLRISEGDHFTFAEWQADRERLIAFYQDHGFFEVRVRARRLLPTGAPIETANSDTAIDAILLEYAIDRGRPTRLEISGFDVPRRVRQRIVARWASAIFDGFLERDAALIVREYLYGERRFQAMVTAAIQATGADGGKTLRITIDPGPLTTAQLVFEGNALIETSTLLAVAQRAGPLAPWLDPASFRVLIERLYHDAGLLSAQIDVERPHIDDTTSMIRVVIHEGKPWLVGRVTIEGAPAAGLEGSNDRLGIAVDSRYTPKAIADGVAALEQRLRDAGFLGAHVSAETALDPSTHRANVRVIAESGPRTILESVSVDGSAAGRAAVARNSSLETGTPISASELSAIRRRLYQTGVYRSVDIDLEPAPDSRPGGDRRVIARFRVEERPRYSFRYGLAMNDDVVAPGQRAQKLGFAADLDNGNVFGRGATLGLSARIRSDQEVGRLNLGVPRFFGLPVRSNVFLSRGREEDISSGGDFQTKATSDVTNISSQQTVRLRKFVDVRYGYDLGRNRTTILTLERPDIAPIIVDLKVARLTTGSSADRRNDPFDPSHGWFTSGNLELSRPGLGSDISFLKTFLQRFQFFPIGHGAVLASAARMGLARTYRDETLIPSERFFAGGATSVRGYKDDDLGPRSIFDDADGGAALLIGNGELRFPIYKWLRGVGFIDIGNVYPSVTAMFHSGVQAGAGGGIRLGTPVGILRLDLGRPLNPRPFDSPWTVHFGLGHAF